MNSNEAILRRDEEYVLGLRRLYESYGYKNFKMSKFEKYDLYLENKSFLRNGNIITVTDPAGRLLALKPDITLSIVKNVRAAALPEKVYYNENIYIADSNAGEIKETTQVGLEYIGDLDVRALSEILILASESLLAADDNYRIAISHMGFVSEIVNASGASAQIQDKIFGLIKDKNLHGLKTVCSENNISTDATDRLCGLITVCGSLNNAIDGAKKLVCGEISSASICELAAISDIITSFGLSDKFILDFSVMNDYSYYNGLVFQGFIGGIPKAVLSGGRYDNLVRRFGCNTSAAGFAVYIDLLSRLHYCRSEFDCDTLLVYDKNCSACDVLSMQKKLVSEGERCIALPEVPSGYRYKRIITMSSDGSLKYE